MNAWMQRGVSHLAVLDLDSDGVEEVVVVLSGHWNQLNVYRGGSGVCLWTRCFGPARSRSRFMSSLVVADLTGDGRREIVVGMANGWACAFDCAGTPIWQERFPSGIASMCAVGRPARLAVGCQNGELLLIDPKGQTLRSAKLDARVSSVIAHGHSIVAGTDAGTVARLGTRF